MGITLGTNIASLKAQRQLFQTGETLGTVFERLSSGQRINRASDDAAGLAIADELNARSRIYTQGIRNLNDGLSLFNIGDSSLANLSGIVVRLKELAEQAANGVYGVEQRKALDVEAQTLKDEFFRIIETTEFNDQKLFTADVSRINLQGGIGDGAVLSLGVGGARGDGSFAAATSYLTISDNPILVEEVDLGDVNGDGALDIISTGKHSTQVMLGNGDGSFGSVRSFHVFQGAGPDSGFTSLELGDVNGDGILDITTSGYLYINTTYQGIGSVQLGNGDGSFGDAVTFLMESDAGLGSTNDHTLEDLNNDGVLDFISVGQAIGGDNQGFATVRLGVGDGTFGDATSYLQNDATGFALTRSVDIGDINGDGILDLVSTGIENDGSQQSFTTIRLGTGDGTFGDANTYQAETGVAAGHNSDTKLEDLNGDGILDLITAGHEDDGDVFTPSFVNIRFGNGDGTFGSQMNYQQVTGMSVYGAALELGDINGDGITDLLTSGYIDGTPEGLVVVRLGNGDGSFGDTTSYTAEVETGFARTSSVKLGDLNNDGVLDLVTGGEADDALPTAGGGFTTVRLGSTTDGVAPLLEFSLTTIADAKQALSQFSHKLDQLSSQRGEIGANQSRLDVATRVLDVSSENFLAAESRIRSADIAEESAELVRANILQQAASSVLAQANQQPSLALQLLG